ncbi:MAG TPA: GIY-YIG nuclease family protein, partial [Sphingobacteriaceae bacterium]
MSNSRGITITNYLASGDPEGVVFAFISNWTGQAIKIPRNLFADSKDMPELNRPGIYFLLGRDEVNPDDKLV